MRVVFSRSARRQAREAAVAFHHHDPLSVTAFERRLDEVVGRLAAFPELGQVLPRTKLRRVPLQPFPYLLFYEILPDRIRILAIWHAKQSPRSWLSG